MKRRLLNWIATFGSEESGQGATEYMLVVSVVVVALVSGGYTFVPMFKTGVHELGSDVAQILRTGKIAGGGVGGGQFRGTTGSPSLMDAAPNEGVPLNQMREDLREFMPQDLQVPMDANKGFNAPINRVGHIS